MRRLTYKGPVGAGYDPDYFSRLIVDYLTEFRRDHPMAIGLKKNRPSSPEPMAKRRKTGENDDRVIMGDYRVQMTDYLVELWRSMQVNRMVRKIQRAFRKLLDLRYPNRLFDLFVD